LRKAGKREIISKKASLLTFIFADDTFLPTALNGPGILMAKNRRMEVS
jgi:hypothetical protein